MSLTELDNKKEFIMNLSLLDSEDMVRETMLMIL